MFLLKLLIFCVLTRSIQLIIISDGINIKVLETGKDTSYPSGEVISMYTKGNTGRTPEISPEVITVQLDSIDVETVLINEKKKQIIWYIDTQLLEKERNIYNFKSSKFTHSGQEFYVMEINNDAFSYDRHVSAYYCRQDEYIDIPVRPSKTDPKYVFTAPLSGCNLVADYLDADSLRVYHVAHENAQYNRLPDKEGHGMVAAITYKDYGYQSVPGESKKLENFLGDAMMEFDGFDWNMHYQAYFKRLYVKMMQFKPNIGYSAEIWYHKDTTVLSQGQFKIRNRDRYNVLRAKLMIVDEPSQILTSDTRVLPPYSEWLKGEHKRLADKSLEEASGLESDGRIKEAANAYVKSLKFLDKFDTKETISMIRKKINDLRIQDKSDTDAISTCFRGGFKRKRSTSNCLFNRKDVERFSDGTINVRRPDDVNINSEKFFKFLKNNKNSAMNEQLMQVFKNNKQIKIDMQENVIFQRVIDDHGFDQLTKKQRLNHLNTDLLTDNRNLNLKNGAKIRNRLTKTVDKIMLVYGIGNVVSTCSDGSKLSCGLSVGRMTWSLASNSVERVVVKYTPKITSAVAQSATKLIASRILPKNSKFVIHFIGAKYGAKIAHGTVGAVGVIFDVYDVKVSAKNMIHCMNRENTDDPCSEKEFRDSIASLTFAGVSLVSGVALLATPGIGTAVSVAIMVGQGTYNGISNIIEYRDKYQTTHMENWNIFWDTFFDLPIDDNIVGLAMQKEFVDHKAKMAWEFLENSPQNVFACGLGLGYKYANKDPLPHHAKIILNSKSTAYGKDLSRAIPNPIANSTMLCLPHYSHDNFENGVRQNVSTAIHYCENALVIADKRRIVNGDSIVLYLKDVDEGQVVGSNKFKNIFLVYRGNTEIIGGNYTINKFMLFSPLFSNRIVGGIHSMNIIDVSGMTKFQRLVIEFQQRSCIGGRFIAMLQNFQVLSDRIDSKNYTYIGRTNNLDVVSCFTICANPVLMIDSSGGIDKNTMDIVKNCKNVILSPFTKMISTTNNHTIYVVTKGYIGSDLYSSIDISLGSPANILFPEFELIDDSVQLTYRNNENTLSIKIKFGLHNENVYDVELKNFIYPKEGMASPFYLFDKFGYNVVPRITASSNDNITEIDSFELHIGCTKECSTLVDKQLKRQKNSTRQFRVLTTIKNSKKNETFTLGSQFNDVIYMSGRTSFAGQEGSDIYVIENIDSINDDDRKIYHINNNANDYNNIDVLSVRSVPNKYTINKCDLHITFNDRITVQFENYFLDVQHQHIMFLNDANEAFVPNIPEYFDCSTGTTSIVDGDLVRFIHATSTQNEFLFSKDFDENNIMIDGIASELDLYKDGNDLMLIRSIQSNPLTIKFEDFYLDRAKWENIYLMLYDKGTILHTDGLLFDDDDVKELKTEIQQDYESIFEEYAMDFSEALKIIDHNNPHDIITKSNEHIGILIITNIEPRRLKVQRNMIGGGEGDKDLILIDEQSKNELRIKNWDTNPSHRISIIEFQLDLFEPVTIRNLNQYTTQDVDKIQELINTANENYKYRREFTKQTEIGVKCLVSLNGLMRKVDTYPCTGHMSLDDQIYFIEKYCDVERLTAFRENASVEQTLTVIRSLKTDFILNGNAHKHEITYCSNLYLQPIDKTNDATDSKFNLANYILYMAIKSGNAETVCTLFGNASVSVTDRDIDGCYPLHWTAKFGQTEIAKYLNSCKNHLFRDEFKTFFSNCLFLSFFFFCFFFK